MIKTISNEAVIAATGKSWDEWRRLLKQTVREEWSHKQIVTYLRENHHLSHWWGQTVTVDFEQSIKGRKIGQTQSADFQIGVRKTLDIPLKKTWDFLMSREGINFWLGHIDMLALEEGSAYRTDTETTGIIRINKPYHHIRLTWKPRRWDVESILQIRVYTTPSGKTTIALHQEKLKNDHIRDEMRSHWKKVLNAINEHFTNPEE